jgi:hypothetical protein
MEGVQERRTCPKPVLRIMLLLLATRWVLSIARIADVTLEGGAADIRRLVCSTVREAVKRERMKALFQQAKRQVRNEIDALQPPIATTTSHFRLAQGTWIDAMTSPASNLTASQWTERRDQSVEKTLIGRLGLGLLSFSPVYLVKDRA